METTIQIPDNIGRIAGIIRNDWPNVYFGAEPYLNAMATLNSINDYYGLDSADNIIRYFLGNAQTWRGPVARAVKAKLNELLKSNQ